MSDAFTSICFKKGNDFRLRNRVTSYDDESVEEIFKFSLGLIRKDEPELELFEVFMWQVTTLN